MYISLIVLHVIASVTLILVILLQAGRGGGLSESFGVSSTQTFFGTSAAKFLQKATTICAIVFLLTSLSLAALSTRKSRSLMDKQRLKDAVEDLVNEGEIPVQEGAVTEETPPLGSEQTEPKEAGQPVTAGEATQEESAFPIE